LKSDALWNLLLEILDKATLMLGDNRKVDFSRIHDLHDEQI
jgi:ATP-dependent Clp protease ATP-binding subunit ClpB